MLLRALALQSIEYNTVCPLQGARVDRQDSEVITRGAPGLGHGRPSWQCAFASTPASGVLFLCFVLSQTVCTKLKSSVSMDSSFMLAAHLFQRFKYLLCGEGGESQLRHLVVCTVNYDRAAIAAPLPDAALEVQVLDPVARTKTLEAIGTGAKTQMKRQKPLGSTNIPAKVEGVLDQRKQSA